MASSAPSTHGRWAPSLTRVWGPRWPAACLANANTQPATPHPPVEHKCTLSKRRARECSWPVYLEATMSTGVQIRSHSRTSGHHGQRKGRAALPVGGPPGPRQWGSVCTIMSGLAEPLLPRNRVAQDTGLGRSWGQPRGLDWLAGHVHQTRGRHPSPPRALKTYFHREQRARKQAEMGARPAETPTVPLPGYGWQQRTHQPTTALPKCLHSSEPTRVPDLTGGVWAQGPGRPHLNSALSLAGPN